MNGPMMLLRQFGIDPDALRAQLQEYIAFGSTLVIEFRGRLERIESDLQRNNRMLQILCDKHGVDTTEINGDGRQPHGAERPIERQENAAQDTQAKPQGESGGQELGTPAAAESGGRQNGFTRGIQFLTRAGRNS